MPERNNYFIKIELFENEKLIKEGVLKKGSISIGSSPDNTYIIHEIDAPKKHILIKKEEDGNFVLFFDDNLNGKIIFNDKHITFEDLRKIGAEKEGNLYKYIIKENTKGVVYFQNSGIIFYTVYPEEEETLLVNHSSQSQPNNNLKHFLHNVYNFISNFSHNRIIIFLILSTTFHLLFILYVMNQALSTPTEQVPFWTKFEKIAEFIPPELEKLPPISEEEEGEDVTKKEESKEEVKEETKPEIPKEIPKVEEIKPPKVKTPVKESPKREAPQRIASTKGEGEPRTQEEIREKISQKGILGAAKSSDIYKEIVGGGDKGGDSQEPDLPKALRDLPVASGKGGFKIPKSSGSGDRFGTPVNPFKKGGEKGGGGDKDGTGERLTEAKQVTFTEKTQKKVTKIDTGIVKTSGGQIEKSSIRQVVDSNISGIRYCYERELKNNPSMTGKVVIRFTVGEDGKVKSWDLVESTLPGGTPVTECILNKVKNWKFQPPKNGEVTVVYPFIFTAIT